MWTAQCSEFAVFINSERARGLPGSMGTLIVVGREAPFGVGAPFVGDMTESGVVDVNALRDGRVETFANRICGAILSEVYDRRRSARTARL